jgi:hypothetical protein
MSQCGNVVSYVDQAKPPIGGSDLRVVRHEALAKHHLDALARRLEVSQVS